MSILHDILASKTIENISNLGEDQVVKGLQRGINIVIFRMIF